MLNKNSNVALCPENWGRRGAQGAVERDPEQELSKFAELNAFVAETRFHPSITL